MASGLLAINLPRALPPYVPAPRASVLGPDAVNGHGADFGASARSLNDCNEALSGQAISR